MKYVATGPLDVGGDEVLHYEEGDEVPGAEGFANLQSLLDDGRLVEGKGSKGQKAAEAAEAAEPEGKPKAKRSGSRSRSK